MNFFLFTVHRRDVSREEKEHVSERDRQRGKAIDILYYLSRNKSIQVIMNMNFSCSIISQSVCILIRPIRYILNYCFKSTKFLFIIFQRNIWIKGNLRRS